MKEKIERIATALNSAYEAVQGLQIQSARTNIVGVYGCLAALEEAMDVLRTVEVPQEEPETELPAEEWEVETDV